MEFLKTIATWVWMFIEPENEFVLIIILFNKTFPSNCQVIPRLEVRFNRNKQQINKLLIAYGLGMRLIMY